MDELNDTTVAIPTQSPVAHQESGLIRDTSSIFPTEIYERILDFLASETISEYPRSPSSLMSCCLTSRLWLPRSRFHLYFQVELSSRARFEEFARCLELNPSRSHFVKRLSIYSYPGQGWEPALSLALAQKLSNLSTLILRNFDLRSFHPRFPHQLSLSSTVSTLELLSGQFHGLSLVQMISALPRLQKLSLNFESVYLGGASLKLALAHWKKPLPLRHLSLNKITACILLPALVASATPLTTFHFRLLRVSIRLLEWVLRFIGSLLSSCRTLHTLRLDFRWIGGRSVCRYLSFSSLSDLHRLLLDFSIKGVEDIAAVAGLLLSISARSLQFLQLNLYVASNREIMNTLAVWEVLNEALLRPNVRSAGEITISIEVRDGTYASEEEVFGLLPALKTMNVVGRWSRQRYEAFWNKL